MLSCRYHKLSTSNWRRRERLPVRIGLLAKVLSLRMLQAITSQSRPQYSNT